MIRLNPLPLLYLSGSGYSGYHGLKSAYYSIKDGAQAIFGSQALNERIVECLSDIKDGDFSYSQIIFGSEDWKERTKKVLSFVSFAIEAIACGIFSYSLYYFSTLPTHLDQNQLDQCHSELAVYKKNIDVAQLKYDYWTHNLCELEQKHWESVVPEVEACFEASSSWFNIPYFSIDYFCEKTFNQETFHQANKHYIPRNEVDLSLVDLHKEKKSVSLTCARADYEVDKQVNQKCNAFYPFVIFDSATMCPLLKWLPSKISAECLTLCQNYLDQAQVVKEALDTALPRTKELTLNCTNVLEKEPIDFPEDIIPRDKFLSPNGELMDFLSKHKDDYKGYWKKGVHVHQEFNEEERLRNKEKFPWENDDLPESERTFLQSLFLQRRRLIKDLESKVKLLKTADENLLKGSDKLSQAKMVYVN